MSCRKWGAEKILDRVDEQAVYLLREVLDQQAANLLRELQDERAVNQLREVLWLVED